MSLQPNNNQFKSNINTVTCTDGLAPLHCVEILPPLVDPEHRACDAHQLEQVPDAEGLGLEDGLQEREVDDARLAHQRAQHRVVEHLVSEKGQFPPQNGLALAAARQGVEHVEKHKAGECHGRVVSRHDARALARIVNVIDIPHLVDVNQQSAEHDEQRRREHPLDERLGKDSSRLRARRTRHDGRIDRLNTQRLRGRTVHKDVYRN